MLFRALGSLENEIKTMSPPTLLLRNFSSKPRTNTEDRVRSVAALNQSKMDVVVGLSVPRE